MSSIGQNNYSHAASRFTGPNQMLMSSPGTYETIVLDLDSKPVGHVVGRTSTGIGTFQAPTTYPLLAPTTTASTPSFSFDSAPQEGLYTDGIYVGLGLSCLRFPVGTSGFALASPGCAPPDDVLSAACGMVGTSSVNSTFPATITGVGNCFFACQHNGIGVVNEFSIADGRASAMLACRTGSAAGSSMRIVGTSFANLIAACANDQPGSAVTTTGFASTVIGVRPGGLSVSVAGTAGVVCGLLGQATIASTAVGSGVFACRNAGTITCNGSAQAVIGCSMTTGGTITAASTATASAVIACGAGISMTASNTLAAAVTNSVCDDANAACIGGTGLNSNGTNSLTSTAMFASAFNVTCDASQKSEMEDVDVPRAEFIAKLKATKPKRYRLKAEDKGAKKRRGFDAADLDAFNDVVVKTGRQAIKVRQTEDGKWEDKDGKKYNNADPDSDGENDDEEDDRPQGRVYRDKQLSHAYVDVTAMLSLVWEGLQHMQSQIDELKAATVSVKVGL